MDPVETEHAAFQCLTEALGSAAACARALARLRPDQSRQWEKMAEAYTVAEQAVWTLAGEGTLHTRSRQ